ncbi:MAG: glycine--tRNA ligase subunit beta [Rhodospirillales bacterium]|jgi:glycyl-tRNA synthetase beta chain|nr:glycine--tRNA ligase subunit beta [Rhodospirillales bacterium]MDP7214585.1 glycine--tRNA ligase subunit beta [Rhodospirillales bacterium]HIJ42906.1 glycine--tRNA ligase subunit beta [Rhodospirillaceae bacterium]HIJ44843.1 glycine--tRNA ligase subunit beta [Rhodospirillaceae bacterium]HIJ93302.1 glycine--tRNA ligase subunit beta [Rhodospirillaceae bacterium]
MAELLLELLSEEIPARMQGRAAEDLKRLIRESLKADDLKFSKIETYSTPRRLTLFVNGLPLTKPAIREEKRGPRSDAPDKAVGGFAKTNKVSKWDLKIKSTEKGEFYFAVVETPEQVTSQLVPLMVETVLFNLRWPKSMRWGNSAMTWVRPIRNILVIFDGKPVKGSIQLGTSDKIPGLNAGIDLAKDEKEIKFVSMTRGHRFLAPKPFEVKDFAGYKKKLRQAKVMLDPAERRALIKKKSEALAKKAGLVLRDDPALLGEVTGLVEWPVVLIGKIDKAFMGLPSEVLSTAMRHHQKYFALEDKKGKLAPRFVVVANTEAGDGGKAIVAGNERVLRARLADAEFFWRQDRKATLESRLPALRDRVFHAKLGSDFEKVERIGKLAADLSQLIAGAEQALVGRAALLCKADLSTEMVGEFPELQGIMGRYYAAADGEKAEVAAAVAEHYSPQGPNDTCPTAPVSVAVSLADKIDTLVGFFGIDEKPTGSKDPYALRRAALGVIRLIIENNLRLPLIDIFDKADFAYAKTSHAPEVNLQSRRLLFFFAERLKVHLREKGVRHDHIDAVFALDGEDDLVRLLARVEALGRFLDSDDGANLLTAYKRAANILRIEEKKDAKSYRGEPDAGLFQQADESSLHGKLGRAMPRIAGALKDEKFAAAMTELSRLRQPVDTFFDEVTVNCGDEKLRENRLKLLSRIRATMEQVADFNKIEGGEK